MSIFTALTLELPETDNEVAKRFLGPAMSRLFGDYRAPAYAGMMRDGTLPDNVEVSEFFLQAGNWVGAPRRNKAISPPITHVHAMS